MSTSVSKAVWNWQERAETAVEKSSGRPRPATVLIELAIMLAVAGVLKFVFDKHILSAIVCVIASLVFIGGFFVLPIYAGFKRFGLFLAHIVGVGLTWGLLAPFFYICFTLGHLGLALKRKDPLHRKLDPSLETYWLPHAPIGETARYRKQF